MSDKLQELSKKFATNNGPFTSAEDILIMDGSMTMYQIAISLGRDLESVKNRRKELSNQYLPVTREEKASVDMDSPIHNAAWKAKKNKYGELHPRMERYLKRLNLWGESVVSMIDKKDLSPSEYKIADEEMRNHFWTFTGEEMTSTEEKRIKEILGFDLKTHIANVNWRERGLNYDFSPEVEEKKSINKTRKLVKDFIKDLDSEISPFYQRAVARAVGVFFSEYEVNNDVIIKSQASGALSFFDRYGHASVPGLSFNSAVRQIKDSIECDDYTAVLHKCGERLDRFLDGLPHLELIDTCFSYRSGSDVDDKLAMEVIYRLRNNGIYTSSYICAHPTTALSWSIDSKRNTTVTLDMLPIFKSIK